jgi:hypothetical protein
MKNFRFPLAAAIAAVGLFFTAPAFAQGAKVMTSDGNYCPIGFNRRGGQCHGSDDYVGFYRGKGGSCPADWRSSGNYCVYSENEHRRNGVADANMRSYTWTFARIPLLARVSKTAEIDMCPTGYFTHRTDIKMCVTHFADAPKSRPATGGKCGAGETLERGKYCTGATTMKASDMVNANTYDHNELYISYGNKHGNVPTLDKSFPEVGSPAMTALTAERDAERAKAEAANQEALRKHQAQEAAQQNHRNEQQRIACESGRVHFPAGFPPGHPCAEFAAAQAAQPAAPAAAQAPAQPTQAPQANTAGGNDPGRELNKALGGALKGVFGR